MAYQNLQYDVDNHIATITLNRPQVLNALSTNLKNEIRAALAEAAVDYSVRVVIIRGAGRAFSAGYDVRGDEYPAERSVKKYAPRLQDDLEFTMAPFDHPKPVIAQIHGYCMGGALEFALMCDLRFASDDTIFGVVETRFADGVATMIHPWIIGPSRAKDLIFSGRRVTAREALEMGLINRVTTGERLEEETHRYATVLAKIAPEALIWNKKAVNGAMEIMGLRGALAHGLQACIALDSSETEMGREFYARARRDGLTAAIRWRDAEFEDTQ